MQIDPFPVRLENVCFLLTFSLALNSDNNRIAFSSMYSAVKSSGFIPGAV